MRLDIDYQFLLPESGIFLPVYPTLVNYFLGKIITMRTFYCDWNDWINNTIPLIFFRQIFEMYSVKINIHTKIQGFTIMNHISSLFHFSAAKFLTLLLKMTYSFYLVLLYFIQAFLNSSMPLNKNKKVKEPHNCIDSGSNPISNSMLHTEKCQMRLQKPCGCH